MPLTAIVRAITVIAIIAAAAAGIAIAVPLYFFPVTRTTTTEPAVTEEEQRQELIVGGVTPNGYRQVNVTVNEVELVTDIAATGEQRRKGLSVKDNMTENEAMLFLFDDLSRHSFWMSGMKFPIDIIWLDDNKTVVHVEHELEPCAPFADCPQYRPDADSLYVLETVAGFSSRYNVTDGTEVEFDLDSQ